MRRVFVCQVSQQAWEIGQQNPFQHSEIRPLPSDTLKYRLAYGLSEPEAGGKEWAIPQWRRRHNLLVWKLMLRQACFLVAGNKNGAPRSPFETGSPLHSDKRHMIPAKANKKLLTRQLKRFTKPF